MLTVTFISVFPDLHRTWAETSLSGRALSAGLVRYNYLALSDFVPPQVRIDTPACGPGAGMVIRADVAQAALEHAREQYGDGYTIFFSPQGELLNQDLIRDLSSDLFDRSDSDSEQLDEQKKSNKQHSQHIILFCGRYEGVDVRVEHQYADRILSIGDYVLMGGDLPAQVLLEGLLRYLPGVVGNKDSVAHDSLSDAYLDYDAYGLPVNWEGVDVPEVLLSGNHARIEAWRNQTRIAKTVERRFDWLRASQDLSRDKKAKEEILSQYIPPHYVVLMHDQVLVGKKEKKEGVTSVTTLDLHDIARASRTYGIEKFFIVTPLQDQHKMLDLFLGFWRSPEGKAYNATRCDAVSRIQIVSSFEDVQQYITEKHGAPACVLSTSACNYQDRTEFPPLIDYTEQGRIWKDNRPVALVFGTGQGLTEKFLKKTDALLLPVGGFTNYNHLSVRSAVAIILDRWLGMQVKNRDKS